MEFGQTRLLVCTVAYDKVFPSGKSFTVRFKCGMYGKAIEALAPQLTVGTLVAVSGEVSLDTGKPDDARSVPALKLTGNISLLEAPKETVRPNEQQNDSGESRRY